MAKKAEKTDGPDLPNLLATGASQEPLRCAGAGALSDYAKMAHAEGGTLTITPEEAVNMGAGFVQDLMRMQAREDGGGGSPPIVGAGPTLASITPDTAVVDSGDFVASLIGTGFTTHTVMNFNGIAHDTTLGSDTEIFASIHTAGATAGSVQVFVTEAGLSSDALQFTFTDPVTRSGRK